MNPTDDDPWADYYRKVAGREPRALFQRLIHLLPAADNEQTPRLAIDFGCGDGTETIALLAAGWDVLAIDQSPAAIQQVTERAGVAGGRLRTQKAPFAEAVLPPADLIYAGLSLPFCPPADFSGVWTKIRQALRPGGCVAAHFFGVRDSWADKPDMTFHTVDALHQLVKGLAILDWREIEEDRAAAFEPLKHFHYFEVIGRSVMEHAQPDVGSSVAH